MMEILSVLAEAS